MKIISKIKREITVALSQLGIRKAHVNYLGLRLQFPLICGMGKGYFIPGELWMGECLRLFLAQKPGIVIDVGSNVGVFLVKLRVHDKERMYYGFDPNPACVFYTNELIRMNEFQYAQVLPVAISDKSGIKTLFAGKIGDKGGSMHKVLKKGNRSLDYSFSIKVLDGNQFLDLIEPDEVCVIKVDVEGAELEVLRGLNEVIHRFRPFLYCEMHEIPDKEDPAYPETLDRHKKIFRLLDQLGYLVFCRSDKGMIERVHSVDEMKPIMDGNYIFTPKESAVKLRQELESASKSLAAS